MNNLYGINGLVFFIVCQFLICRPEMLGGSHPNDTSSLSFHEMAARLSKFVVWGTMMYCIFLEVPNYQL